MQQRTVGIHGQRVRPARSVELISMTHSNSVVEVRLAPETRTPPCEVREEVQRGPGAVSSAQRTPPRYPASQHHSAPGDPEALNLDVPLREPGCSYPHQRCTTSPRPTSRSSPSMCRCVLSASRSRATKRHIDAEDLKVVGIDVSLRSGQPEGCGIEVGHRPAGAGGGRGRCEVSIGGTSGWVGAMGWRGIGDGEVDFTDERSRTKR